MSFASQIISSVNKDNSNEDNSNENILSATPSTPSTPDSSDSDIGFKSDIDTQIRESTTPRRSYDSNSMSSSSRTTKTTEQNSTPVTSWLSWASPFFVFGNSLLLTISFLVICLLVLRSFFHVPIPNNFFTYLGELLDRLVGYIYTLFMKVFDFLRPTIDLIRQSIYGSAKVAASSTAQGLKSTVHATSDIVDDVTDPVIKNEKSKVKQTLVDDLNHSSKKNATKVVEDESTSDIQTTKGSWCFIGEDNGTRMCARTDGNECMSGLVYISKEECVNR